MSQILSVILVIMMVFSSAGSMIAKTDEPVFLEAQVSADAQSVLAMAGAGGSDADGRIQQTAKLIEDILNTLTLKGFADKETAELALLSGDEVILSFGVKTTEEGSTFASNLLGSQTLYFSKAILEQLRKQMMSSMSQNVSSSGNMDIQSMAEQFRNMDWMQISKDAGEAFEPLTAAVLEKMGEPEPGEYTVDGAAFAVKVPLNITYDELSELMLKCAKDLLGRESVKPLTQMFSQGSDLIESIDKALEDLKNQPAEEKPVLTIATYSNEDSADTYFACDVVQKAAGEGTQAEEKIHFGMGTADGKTKVAVNSSQAVFDLVAGQAEDGSFSLLANLAGEGFNASADIVSAPDGSSEVTVDVTVQGMPVRSHTRTAREGERVNFEAEIYMMSMDKPMLTVKGSSGKGGEKVCVYEGEDVETVPFEKLMSKDSTEMTTLQMTLVSRMLNAITVLSRKLPEDSAGMLTDLVKQTITPGESTKTE